MGFNYAKEKAKFEREWAKLRREYAQAGMSEATIQEIHDFDWAAFLAERTYVNRTQSLPDEISPNIDKAERTKLLRKFRSLSVSFEVELGNLSRNWADYLEDPRLLRGIKKLSKEERELLVLIALLEYSQSELAKILDRTPQAVSKQYKKIKEKFK